MIARHHILAVIASVLLAPAAGAVEAQQGQDMTQRARLFSDICMGSAPDFLSLDTRAEAAGLVADQDGWVLAPDLFVKRIDHQGFCSCFMSMAATDQDAQMQAVQTRLIADYGDSFKGPDRNWIAVAPFDRNGIEVVSMLEPRDFLGQPWLVARLTVVGPCAHKEMSQ